MKYVISTLIASLLFHSLLNGQTDSLKDLSIGDHYQGGVIFYIDQTGQHGLIAAPFDQPEKTCWGNEGRANATYMNEGDLNTEQIITFLKNKRRWDCSTPAAWMCDKSTLGGFTDWYLPSINELKEMYDKQKMIGNFNAGDYCSSTESRTNKCWSIHFRPHRKLIYHDSKIYFQYFVRCIRKF